MKDVPTTADHRETLSAGERDLARRSAGRAHTPKRAKQYTCSHRRQSTAYVPGKQLDITTGPEAVLWVGTVESGMSFGGHAGMAGGGHPRRCRRMPAYMKTPPLDTLVSGWKVPGETTVT